MLRAKKSKAPFTSKTRIKFMAYFHEEQENMLESCAVLCGTDRTTGQYICTDQFEKQPVCNKTTFNDQFINEWFNDTTRVSHTVSKIKPVFNGFLGNWSLTMEFARPLVYDLRTWIATGFVGTAGQTTVTLRSESWNRLLDPTRFLMTYEVAFYSKQNKNHLVCAKFCGTTPGSDERICYDWLFMTLMSWKLKLGLIAF